MRQFNDEAFLSELNEVPWETAYIFDDVDDLWDHWAKLYNEVLDKHAPLKKKRVRGDQLPWMTPELNTKSLAGIVYSGFTPGILQKPLGKPTENKETGSLC